ncbi:MAG: chemotaxis protein CheW [Leptospira sp.]|nr:chemotaxis protein CheW [Leptospira sp.]
MKNRFNAWQEVEAEDTMEGLYLSFSVNQRDYAFEVRNLVEIVALPKITSIPGTANFLRGVINLRGKVIPVMDMRLRFLIEAIDYSDRTCVLIVKLGEILLGLIVDKVLEVLRIPAEHIDPAPKIGESQASQFITSTGRVEDKLIIIIDLNKLLNDDESQVIKQVPVSG